MKKVVVPVLIFTLLVIGYFSWVKIYQNPSEIKEITTVLEEGDVFVPDISQDIEGYEGVTVGFEPLKDPGVPVPSLYRELGELTTITKEALDKTIAILEEDHLDPDSWIYIGSIWSSGGNYKAASEAWEYVYALEPMNEVALNNLGFLYTHNIGDLKAAEDWYKKAVIAGPKYPVTYINMAEFYLYKKDSRKKAIAIIKQGLKELPQDGTLNALKDRLESGGSI